MPNLFQKTANSVTIRCSIEKPTVLCYQFCDGRGKSLYVWQVFRRINCIVSPEDLTLPTDRLDNKQNLCSTGCGISRFLSFVGHNRVEDF